jgi:hypothetical protein
MVSQFSGTVEIFDTSSMPWMFVRVPDELCAPYWHLQERGLIAVTATVGSTAWDTSDCVKKNQGFLILLDNIIIL